MTPIARRTLPRRIRRLALLATAFAVTAIATGCTEFDRVFGLNQGGNATVLKIQAISLRTDHPVSAANPTGPASIGSTGVVTFSAIGTFTVNGTATLQTNDVSAGVIWTSSNPALALPGSDGKVAAHGSAGAAIITATSPALGDIPAMSSNPVTLTIQ